MRGAADLLQTRDHGTQARVLAYRAAILELQTDVIKTGWKPMFLSNIFALYHHRTWPWQGGALLFRDDQIIVDVAPDSVAIVGQGFDARYAAPAGQNQAQIRSWGVR